MSIAVTSLVPQRDDDQARLVALYAAGLLDATGSPALDELTRLATHTFDVPLCRVTVVSHREVRSLSRAGSLESSARWPRDGALCNEALGRDAMFIATDETLAEHREGPPLAFYAAVVLRTADGHPIGTLHLGDTKPRTLSLRDRRVFLELGRLVERQLLTETAGDTTSLDAFFRDPHTGLPLEQSLRSHLQRAQITSSPRLAQVNVENLSTVETKHGWDMAMHVMRECATRLGDCLPRSAVLSKLGWNSFAFLVPTTWEKHLQAELDFVGQQLTFPIDSGLLRVHPRVTVGVSAPVAVDVDPDQALHQASRLNAVAREQRCIAVVESEAMRAERTREAEILDRLERALRDNALTLAYQPKYDMDRRPVGGEALARWIDEDLGFISPGEFIPLAEQNGLIRELGWCVIHTACRQIADAKARGLATRPVALNISAPQLTAFGFVGEVLETLRCYGLTPHELQLEVTESVLADDVTAMVARLEELAAHGFAISMDDYGTGYSSLSYLKRLPLTYLKIDRAFVRDMQNDADDAAIIQATIAMAHALSLEVIAEGVEEEAQWRMLCDFGCDQIQGYWLGRPMPWDDFCGAMAEERGTP